MLNAKIKEQKLNEKSERQKMGNQENIQGFIKGTWV